MSDIASSQGSFEQFLTRLRSRESGISPDNARWYEQNLDNLVMRYPKIITIGKLRRSRTNGCAIYEPTTIRSYFSKLGILDIYLNGGPNCFERMQSASTNPWGFIGYQVGEAVLIENGYYTPVNVPNGSKPECKLPSYCAESGEPGYWANGKRERYMWNDQNEMVVCTDVNRWEGEFTGKNGIQNLDDLKTSAAQETVIRTIVKSNLQKIEEEMQIQRISLRDYVNAPAISQKELGAKNGYTRPMITTSGIVASSHLCGWRATLEYLLRGSDAADEIGTTVATYMHQFGAYDIPQDMMPY